MSVQSKMLGTIVGGALGDAIGLFTEFHSRARAIELYGPSPAFTLQDPPPPNLTSVKPDRHRSMFEPSGWTDDTDQSLLIFLSFLASGGNEVDAYDFAKRLKFWVANGLRCLDRLPLGLGKTVGSVVRDQEFETDPFGTAVKYWEGTNRYVAANGAVMRTGIIGALLFQDSNGINGIDRAMDAAVQVAATTHPDPRCLVSCSIVTGLVAAAMRSELHNMQDFDALIQHAIQFIQSPLPASKPNAFVPIPLTQDQLDELNKHVYAANLEDLDLDNRSKIGYTYKCLGSGTWALRKALNAPPDQRGLLFEQCITDITMRGGDADTNATVAGSLLGAFLSDAFLPSHWVQHLRDIEWLIQKTKCAVSLVDPDGDHPAYDYVNDPDVLVDGGKGAFTVEELNKRYDGLMCEVGRRVNDGIVFPGQKKKKDQKEGCVVS